MSSNFRSDLLKASEKHFEAHIEKHRVNVEVMLRNTVGVGDHSDIMDTIEKEFAIIADYEDKLNVIKKYFNKDSKKDTKVLHG
jgi:hypothetical protein